MRYGYFEDWELASKDRKPSPYGPMNVQKALLDLLNDLRAAYGKPLVVSSAYRSPEHNKAVGGVPNSYHTQGLAADIYPLAAHADDLRVLRDICNKVNANGGVGLYDTFVHVDARGYRARWDNRSRQV